MRDPATGVYSSTRGPGGAGERAVPSRPRSARPPAHVSPRAARGSFPRRSRTAAAPAPLGCSKEWDRVRRVHGKLGSRGGGAGDEGSTAGPQPLLRQDFMLVAGVVAAALSEARGRRARGAS